MMWFWGHLYFTILFCIILIQSLNCSLLSRSRNPSDYVLQPAYLPDGLTDEMFNALVEQRPDLEPFLTAQRKTQLRRLEMPYLMKKKRKKSKYPFYEEYERNNSDNEGMLLENDDDDITRPLSDFDDGRTTEIIDPSLVPEYVLTQKYIKSISGINKKEQSSNDTRRFWIFPGPEERAWNNAWKVASCYTCHIGRDYIPRTNLCHTAFNTDDYRFVAQAKYFRTTCYYNWEYRNSGYWRYKRYWWKGKLYPGYRGMTVHRMGCFTKGCMKRYSDVGEVFTMRACRGYWPMYIGGLLEHRQIRNDLWIGIYPNHTCRMAHHATLIPFHRGISLFGRLRSCSCVGRYCNNAVVNNIFMPLLIIGFLLIIFND